MISSTIAAPIRGAPALGARVDIADVSITYRGRRATTVALQPTSITLAPSSFTALIGPSGCGKSTLMNAVGGFVDIAGGTLTIDGTAVTGPNPEVGVIFQQYALFPWFTALGNVKFALKRFKLTKQELESRALQALAEVGLHKQAKKFPGQLAPKVLLMDEPFGALDAQTKLGMHDLLLRVWDKHRPTVVLVTHDVDEALLLADTVHVLSAAPGRIIRTYDIAMPRPRRIETIGPELLNVRAEILSLLKPPEPDDE
jgi:NitT/TauT family transport system ATP-binding protein